MNIIINTLSVLVLGLVTSLSMAKITPTNATITFPITNKTTIQSTTALVEVTVNATLLANERSNVQQKILAKLSSTLPTVKWKTVDYQQTPNASGAMNVFIGLQARITKTQIDKLTRMLVKTKLANQNIQSRIVNFNPSRDTLNKAKNTLMISTYQRIQTFTDHLNQKTNSHYKIISVAFQTDVSNPRPFRNTTMLMGTNSIQSPNTNTQNIQVSQDITMQANVVLLAQLSSTARAHLPLQRTTRLLPPKYLSVKGFKTCLSTKSMGTWRAYCLPHSRPKSCQYSSWTKLKSDKTLTSCHKV